ncbi:hypothetical protein ZOSMA_9G00530 [Zostera marina]|uniref:Calmodulin-binding domain-containing protein n=1 Tax=Zostera marina TaxID=29655 RepID=A0A0K9NIZ3_ZOSMR|nr:hypothetical protein ZOSMA_9G00530 [Zostera marina]
MATVRSDGKERRGRSPPTASVPLLPRSKSSNSPSSSNPRPSSDKAKPNYLKPTFCSCSSLGSNPCKQVQPGKKRCCTSPAQSGQSTKPLSRIRSMEKPPSGPLRPPPARTMTFNSSKDKALLKSPSSSFASIYKVADKPVMMKSSGKKNTHVLTSSISRGRSQTVKKGSNSVSLTLSSGVVTSTRAMEEAMEAIKSEPELIVHVVSQPEIQQPKFVEEKQRPQEEEEEEEEAEADEEEEEVKTSDVPSAELRSDGKEEKQHKSNREEVKGVEEDKNSNKEAAAAYNDVIEETATKLAVEEKKNKVLALVGAFETVISLQEPETPRTPRTPQQQDSNETEIFKNETSRH